jgi:heterodisulfide reductase subunit C
LTAPLPLIHVEAHMRPDFLDEIYRIPGGEHVKDCIQCGTCSGSCPASPHMDKTPRQLMAMIRAGMRDEVLTSNTIWMCASCYLCAVRCPAKIKITDVMYALKRLAIRTGKAAPRNAYLARVFVDNINRFGRNDERLLIARYYTFAAPFKVIGLAPQGLALLTHGRLPIFAFHRVRRIDEIRKIIRHVEEGENR